MSAFTKIADQTQTSPKVRKVPGTDIASTFALTGDRYNIVQSCQRDTRPWRGYSEALVLHAHPLGRRDD
jgi:hypothetical protein